MKYTIIGAGAMGYRFGVMMQEIGGLDVDFIDTWQPNLDKVREQGGVYAARDGKNRHLVPINLFTPEEYQGDPDVWIVFVKQMQLPEFLRRCAPLFKDHQYVFSAMNGMGHIEKLQQYFSDDRIVGGTAMIATVLNGPGDVDFMGAEGGEVMHMVPLTEEPNDTVRALEADFRKGGLGPVLTENFMGTLMAKVVFNAVVNTLCTMFRVRMGEFAEYDGVPDLARMLLDEAYDACERAGIQLIQSRQEEIDSVPELSRKAFPLHYPSMSQDFFKNRPTEVDYINGYIAKLGREHGYICHVHEFITSEMHLAETMRQFTNIGPQTKR